MQNINLTTTDLIRIINNNEYIGKGVYGLVVKINDDYLFKFNYREYLDCFKKEGDKISLKLDDPQKINLAIEKKKKIGYASFSYEDSDAINTFKELSLRQKRITRTTFTQGLVYVNNYCVGYILKYHKNMVNLYDYIKENHIPDEDKQMILTNIKASVQELLENAIYLNDLSIKNILYSPKTKEIQLIDFENNLICCRFKDRAKERQIVAKYTRIKYAIENSEQYLESHKTQTKN